MENKDWEKTQVEYLKPKAETAGEHYFCDDTYTTLLFSNTFTYIKMKIK